MEDKKIHLRCTKATLDNNVANLVAVLDLDDILILMKSLKKDEKPKRCPECSSKSIVRNGYMKYKETMWENFLCKSCGKNFSNRK